MIFLFIIKPRVKKVRNTIHDIPLLNLVEKKEEIIKPRVKKGL